MTLIQLKADMAELSSAEDFLEYFAVDYDVNIVQVNRLHILQRFHEKLEKIDSFPDDAKRCRQLYRQLLTAAYNDFVHSNALTEKVFKVFQQQNSKQAFVPLSDLKL